MLLYIIYYKHAVYIIICTCRFVYADLIGKCCRKMILEYFGEDPTSSSASGACCDVCSSTAESVSDYQNEMQVIIKAVSDVSGQGEKKVNYPQSILCHTRL